MAEWSIAAVLKTVEVKASGGSNPSLPATGAKLSNVKLAIIGIGALIVLILIFLIIAVALRAGKSSGKSSKSSSKSGKGSAAKPPVNAKLNEELQALIKRAKSTDPRELEKVSVQIIAGNFLAGDAVDPITLRLIMEFMSTFCANKKSSSKQIARINFALCKQNKRYEQQIIFAQEKGVAARRA